MEQTHPAPLPATLPRVFEHELTGRAAVALGCALLGASAWINALLSDRLGVFFGVCFVLTALSVALVVDRDGLFIAGVLPPLLMLAVATAVVVVSPGAVDAPHLAVNAGDVQRVIAVIVDHALALVLGHLGALALVGLRIRASST